MPSDALDDLEDLIEPPQEPAWPPAEFELVLRKPVSLDGVSCDRLQLREPTCWEWEQIIAQPIDKQRRFAVQLISGASIKLIALMGIG
ncbi:MAG: phage tail assembly protein, partial [Pseudomonadota bacterium]